MQRKCGCKICTSPYDLATTAQRVLVRSPLAPVLSMTWRPALPLQKAKGLEHQRWNKDHVERHKPSPTFGWKSRYLVLLIWTGKTKSHAKA